MDAATPPTNSIDDDWCSINEAARRLGVTPTAIRNRVKRGTLPTRPNGNLGKLVKVPRTVTLTVPLTPADSTGTVTLTPGEGAGNGDPHPAETVPGTVTPTPEEPVRDTVALTVTLTMLATHIEALQAALTKAEAAAERGRIAEVEAAAVPALRDTVAALKAALDAEQARNRELRRARDRWLSAPAYGPLWRAWRWLRSAG
jgi:hypothetical protein